ncbi:MAG: hypothetical protein RL685_3511 [Pseudomonadota bacterium]|jgi:hypothetical protein
MTSPAIRVPRPYGWLVSIVLALVLLSTSLPSTARAEEPTIDEVRYHPTELPTDSTRTRVLLTGAGLTLGWYGVAVGTSYLYPNAPNARDLRLPVVGPWMALGDVRCGSKERNCRDAVLVIRTVFGVLSGVGQAGGLLAIAEGLFLPTAAAAPGADIRPSATARSQRSWAAVPVVLPDGAGLELVGRF